MRPTNAIEKFQKASDLISNKHGMDINKLLKASMTIFSLSNSDIPNEILASFNSLKNRLSSVKSTNANQGNISQTLKSISKKEYDEIIEEINRLNTLLQTSR